jgi:hypothetical protein
MRYWEIIGENATAGSTSAGNVATSVAGFWSGPTTGQYPYIVPDRSAQKSLVIKRIPDEKNLNPGTKRTLKRKPKRKGIGY